jgi:uncharacterized MAPEG superfamily protein
MTVELTYLVWTSVLLASLWIPYIVGVNRTPTDNVQASFERPADLRTLPAWVHRAHLNLLEQFAPFAVLVILAHVLGVHTTILTSAVIAFFWLRVIHAVGMISGLARFPVRPIIFSAAWIAIVVIAWQILANAPAA